MAASTRLVLLPADDGMHEHSGEANFNESAYYNFYDSGARLGGFVRLGNRANEGYAEMTVCLYLPDGRVAFMYGRPAIADNERFAAGGLAFEVKTPFVEHAIRYDGSCVVLERPLDLFDPRRAFTENPHVPVTIALRYDGRSPAFGGEPRTEQDGRWVSVRLEKGGQEFARGHLEQHGRAAGTVTIGDVAHRVDGFGLRDHSWGPRYWQAPRYYRWLTMNFDDDAGIAAALTVQRDGREMQGGYIYRRGAENRLIERVEVETGYAEPDHLHDRIRATLHPVDGSPERVEGRVLRMVPLRNRRGGVTTRIAEGLTEWTWGDRTGYGWSEYLDHAD
ncbi:MAG TPA: hypothetical protein VKA21_02665 [Candidatus Binatia bacterium]|nr:hypothetical protein [Candidatus Binatia bacterium]